MRFRQTAADQVRQEVKHRKSAENPVRQEVRNHADDAPLLKLYGTKPRGGRNKTSDTEQRLNQTGSVPKNKTRS